MEKLTLDIFLSFFAFNFIIYLYSQYIHSYKKLEHY